MPKAKLIPKKNSVFKTVANPPAETKREWREVQGAFMEHASQENIDTWWDIFTEMARECPDFKSRKKRHR